jgi:hypothetical protein
MDWTPIDTPSGPVEVKINSRQDLLMLRESGQRGEYPHSTISIDKWGEPDYSTLHHSDPANANRFGMREVIQAAVTIALSL